MMGITSLENYEYFKPQTVKEAVGWGITNMEPSSR